MELVVAMLTEAFGMLTKEVNKGDRRLTKKKRKSGLSLELAVKKRDLHEEGLPEKTKTSSVNKPQQQKNSGVCCRCRHVLPVAHLNDSDLTKRLWSVALILELRTCPMLKFDGHKTPSNIPHAL